MEEWTLRDTEYAADQGTQHKHACHSSGLYHPNTAQCQAWEPPPWLRTSPPQTLDPRESPIISEDMKLETLQGQQCSEKEALFNDAFLWKLKMNPIFLPHYQELPSACYSVQSPPPNHFMDANFFCGVPTPDCTDVSEDKYHRCPESKMNWTTLQTIHPSCLC